MTITQFIARVQRQGGFIIDEDLAEAPPEVAELPVLVRCGGTRFLATVGTAAERVAQHEATGDYVRDVSVPSNEHGGRAWAALGFISL